MENSEKIQFAEVFKSRTKKFVVDNIKLFRTLPKTEEAKIIGRQLLRSSSSVGANYRAACRARSKAEFHAKLSTVVEESDESVFWMEIFQHRNADAARGGDSGWHFHDRHVEQGIDHRDLVAVIFFRATDATTPYLQRKRLFGDDLEA